MVAQIRRAMHTREIGAAGGGVREFQRLFDVGAATKAVPTGLLGEAAVAGSTDAVRRRLAEYETAGVTHLFVPGRRVGPQRPIPTSWPAYRQPREARKSPQRRRVVRQARHDIRLGAEFRQGSEVVGLLHQGPRITGVRLQAQALHTGQVVLASGP